MEIPASDRFTPLPLASAFNRDRSALDEPLRLQLPDGFGPQTCRGIPFEFGPPGEANVILLDSDAVRIPVDKLQATYIVFAHIVEDKPQALTPDLADVDRAAQFPSALTGNELGDLVAEYQIEYVDGSLETIPIRRRFAIQQARIGWGASPFAAATHQEDTIISTVTESLSLGRMPGARYGNGETRHGSGRDAHSEHIWLYALPNPFPERAIAALRCLPKDERALIFAISATQVSEHPLRPGLRRKLALTLPPGVEFNAIGELDNVDIDLGYVISGRAKLEYDREAWFGDATDVQPTRSGRVAIIEYAAHPKAKLYLGDAKGKQFAYDLSHFQGDGLVEVAEARRLIKVKVVDAAGKPVAARVHFHGGAGEYLPPRGNHRRVNRYWFEDNYGEFANGRNQYAYIHGHCELEAPLGEVFVEISRGYEIKPCRSSIEVRVDSDEFVFELERALDWRERGWVTADTHVHFLSPQTALLEGAAEGVNVVNLLASQWGEMFSNVSDFDGRSTLGAADFGGDGEFLVRVGTENRMQVMGHISLLGYSGEMIHPLCSGGPSESAIGDALEVSMADWARRCIEQNGLVVLPHGPNPQAERAADIVLELVHAIEMMSFNPFDAQITPYGLLDWYRYLNLGYQVPIVGGSDKMDAQSLLGGMRTYAQLGDREFTYENWMESVKAGNTFVTVGPLLELQVEGLSPGSKLDMPEGGGTVNVSWRVESVAMPLERVEVLCGGLAVEEQAVGGALSAAGSCDVHIGESSWIALRVRGSHSGRKTDIAAHSSCVQIRVGGGRPFQQADAIAVLEQIEGAMAFVDTLAPRPEAQQYKRIRAALESAHNKLHQLMHRQGIFHQHSPLHAHDAHREH
ncbi:MAG: CehA/McbA family metallohydrolase [Chloroflexota bacterium]|nr:CehA/McbA family metallohydrolase [Chloroflexota bacterium]